MKSKRSIGIVLALMTAIVMTFAGCANEAQDATNSSTVPNVNESGAKVNSGTGSSPLESIAGLTSQAETSSMVTSAETASK